MSTPQMLVPHIQSMLEQAIGWNTYDYAPLSRTISFVKWRGPPPAILRACDEGGVFPDEEKILVHFTMEKCDDGPICLAGQHYQILSVCDVSKPDLTYILEHIPLELTKQELINIPEGPNSFKKKWVGKTNFGLSPTGVALVVDLF